jgi:alpha-ketoglutarate-dependent taurine dioxygenase
MAPAAPGRSGHASAYRRRLRVRQDGDMGQFECRPLSDALGVELSGVDFTHPFDPPLIDELRALFERHHLLLVRGQDLSDDDHLRVCRYLLTVLDPVSYVSNVEPFGFHPELPLMFHSDYTFTPWPLYGISLYALHLDPGAAPTRYVNTRKGYDELPQSLRDRVTDRDVMMMTYAVDRSEHIPSRQRHIADDESTVAYPRHVHPLVPRHPRTGDPFIIASDQQANYVLGMDRAESDELLDELLAFLYSDRFIYDHEWETRDLVIRDNLVLQHGRRENPNAVRRSLRRITMGQKPQSELIAGTAYAVNRAG